MDSNFLKHFSLMKQHLEIQIGFITHYFPLKKKKRLIPILDYKFCYNNSRCRLRKIFFQSRVKKQVSDSVV